MDTLQIGLPSTKERVLNVYEVKSIKNAKENNMGKKNPYTNIFISEKHGEPLCWKF